jgi:hypothetical protein
MSISVNLIMDDERRSGSKINVKSVLRITSLAAPLLILMLLMQQSLRYFVIRTNLSMLESRWESAQPRQTQASRLLGRANQNGKIMTEIAAWSDSSPAWDAVLLALMESTPADIQLTTLRLQAAAAPKQVPGGSPPLRRPSVLIEGRASEPEAMRSIEALQRNAAGHAAIASAVSSADVVNFAADPAAPGTQKRVFSIRIQFHDIPEGKR